MPILSALLVVELISVVSAKSFPRIPRIVNPISSAFRAAARKAMHQSHSSAGSPKNLWDKYLLANAKHPIKTAMGSSLVLWALGDTISQSFEGNEKHQFSKARLFGTALEGCFVGGGIGSLWYKKLHHIVSHTLKLRESSVRFVLAKLGLECFLWQPALLLSFWVFVGLFEGHPFPKIRREIKNDFLPALLSDFALFAPLDVINFRLVPVQYQVRRTPVPCRGPLRGAGMPAAWGRWRGIRRPARPARARAWICSRAGGWRGKRAWWE